MTKHQLASQLRIRFAEKYKISKEKVALFTDAEMIRLHNMCDCCFLPILDKDELAEALLDCNNLDEFFDCMNLIISSRQKDDVDIEGDDEDSYDKSLLN